MVAGILRVGELPRMSIEDVAFGGAGVGHVGGLVVFVPFAVTEDEVEVEIRSVRKKYAMGRLRRVLKPSRYRTEPVCPYFGRCGGCQFQHIAYEQQLAIKERQVKEI